MSAFFKKFRWGLNFGVVSALLLVFLSAPAYTSPGLEAEQIADLKIKNNKIIWEPIGESVGLFLSVSGPGNFTFQKLFKSGIQPVFELRDNFDQNFPDGACNYELNALPVVSEELSKLLSEYREWESMGYQTVFDKNSLVQNANRQSGSFSILNGKPVLNDEHSQNSVTGQDPTGKEYDNLVYDDQIVTGSICVGFDCANGESFGYCTHKLKENNVHLCFEDTSVGSFPTNDWKIQCNDTTSGGASYFTVWDLDASRRPFTLEAGAPAHSLYVEDYGRVGLGTSIPYVELHIVDGDSPTIRLDQDGSSGWAAQRWDMCGNETNFFVRDVTNGSKLCFRIQPNTPSNTLCMSSTGNVGIGTWSPGYSLEVERTSENAAVVAERTDGATTYMNATANWGNFGTVNNKPLRLVVDSDWRMRLNSDDSLEMSNNATCTAGGVWTSVSSREAKTNIRKLTVAEASQALESLDPVRFYYKAEKEEEYLGFIAEDVPELVATKDKKHMVDMDVIAVLTKVVQEQQKVIDKLNTRISALESKNAGLTGQ